MYTLSSSSSSIDTSSANRSRFYSVQSSSLQEIIRFSNESAHLLCSGEGGKALSGLTGSLKQLRRFIASAQQEDRNRSTSPGHEDTELLTNKSLLATSSSQTVTLPVSPLSRSIPPSSPVMPTELTIDGLRNIQNFFIYNRCLEVPEIDHPDMKDTDLLSVYSGCLLVNLALTYHRMAVRGSKISLIKAEKMYFMVLQLLSAIPASVFRALPSTIYSMKIIAVNNLAHILHERGQHGQVQALMQRLETLMVDRESTGTFFHSSDRGRLFSNIVLWASNSIAAAA